MLRRTPMGSELQAKHCDYCGRTVEDTALCCAECGTQFSEERTSEPPEENSPPPKPSLPALEPDGISPKWSAQDAWKFLGMLVIFSLVEGVVLAALSARFPQFYHWKVRGFGRFAEATFQYGLFILTALYFSRVESPQTFLKTHGLNLRP